MFVSRILQVVRVLRKRPLQMGVSRVLQQKNPEGWNPETSTSADSVTCGEKKMNHLLFYFLCHRKKEEIQRSLMVGDCKDGGVKMIDVIKWLQRLT